MNHRGVEFFIEQAPNREDLWYWRFEVDGAIRAGKTRARLRLLAIRRVQLTIDRELKKRDASEDGILTSRDLQGSE